VSSQAGARSEWHVAAQAEGSGDDALAAAE